MSEKKISYLNRNYYDYRKSILEFIGKYYPQISNSLNDASIGSWIVDVIASIADNLSFHIDRTYGETNIDTAQQANSIYSLARNNGLKIPGPRASIAELTLSCEVPAARTSEFEDESAYNIPNRKFMPKLKRGTKFEGSGQVFELMDDVDFADVSDANGYADQTIYPKSVNVKGEPITYEITKKALVLAGESNIYKQVISSSDIVPFMEIILPSKNIISVESIIFKDGTNYVSDPSMSEFMNPNEYVPASDSPYNCDTYRFFEVDSLLEQYRWGDDVTSTRAANANIGHSVKYTYGFFNQEANTLVPTCAVTKGEWIPVTQKFTTEYTDNGYLKIIFGTGQQIGEDVDLSDIGDFNKFQISKMLKNDFLGKLPRAGWTMYVLYRTGGGAASNVAANTINRISYLNMDIANGSCTTEEQNMIAAVKRSLSCTNKEPSVSGKDSPSVDEIRAMIKYNNASQNRCVTLKDYENRVLMMPARYGCPFRVSTIEANNKIMMYLLGIDNEGKLSDKIPMTMVKNIENYLSMYRNINDFVEIKNGRIINISIEMSVFLDKTYPIPDVIYNITKKIEEYMDINKHQLGEDIFVGDIEREVGNIDGVLNVIETRVFNEYGPQYSQTLTTQVTGGYDEENRSEIDLEANQYLLTSENDEMYEIKYPNIDIRITPFTR